MFFLGHPSPTLPTKKGGAVEQHCPPFFVGKVGYGKHPSLGIRRIKKKSHTCGQDRGGLVVDEEIFFFKACAVVVFRVI